MKLRAIIPLTMSWAYVILMRNVKPINGLYYNHSFLSGIKPYAHLLPNRMATLFADEVCRKIVARNNIEELKKALPQCPSDLRPEFLNTTSFGNLAYVAKYSKDKDIREQATKAITLARNLSKDREEAQQLYGKRG